MINCFFSPKTQRTVPPSPPRLCLSDTHSWTSFFLSNTPHCSPYCSLHAWSNTHKEPVSYIHLLFTFFFACVIFPYISGGRQGHRIWNSAGRGRLLCVTARLDNDRGQILASRGLEALQSFCRSLILEASFEDGGVGVRWEEGLSCAGREEARLWPVDRPSRLLIKQFKRCGVKTVLDSRHRVLAALPELSMPCWFPQKTSFFSLSCV